MGSFQEMFDAMKSAYESDHPDEPDPVPPTPTPYTEARQLPPVAPPRPLSLNDQGTRKT